MDYPLTLALILEHAHRIHGDKRVSTLCPDGKMHSYSYSEFHRRVKRLANVITEFGVQSGDRIATFASNTYQHLELYYAIPCIGGILHPLNVRLSATQLTEILNEAEDRLIFADGTFAPQFSELWQLRQMDCAVFNSPKEGMVSNRPQMYPFHDYEQLLSEADERYAWDIPDENWAMGLCYTSGTCGEPRGVLYTHRSMFLHTMAVNQADVFGITEADVVMPFVPMFHAMAWGLPYAAMFTGADMVLPAAAKPTQIPDLIAETGITIAAGVPTVWAQAYPELRKRRANGCSLRQIIVGGEAMPPTLIEAYEKELDVEVRHAWGMTEMSPTGTVSKLRCAHSNLSDTGKWKLKAMQGRPIPGVEIRLSGMGADLTTSDAELPWDGKTVGELQVRSPWTASRYYKIEPTLEHFTTEGWLRTGDIATITVEGYVQIVDRAKAIIRSGGESISSIALETVLIAHPQVLDAAVIGVPDKKWGERPVALVVSKAEGISESMLKRHLALQFPKFWIPDKFILVDEIPKTGVGKSDKKAIRQQMLTSDS